ncbi:MAG TPA: DJ-1/PfpI family protein [Candidatus Bathyarchaeia archaeon]|nr:DJ-1/PfpI family protein [Candidatus Bathyarchaeia archaeon]
MNKRKTIILIILSVLILNFMPTYKETIKTKAIHTSDVKILVLMDNNFGSNFIAMLHQYEDIYGWKVTTAGPTSTISGCEYNSLDYEVDIKFSQISDITSYHCVDVMSGSSHTEMMANKDGILDKIKLASDADVVISGWCRSVRVLAAANVINGKNVTGYSAYASEYIAAGAEYYPEAKPIISGNIVTVSATQIYLSKMYLAMAKAIGCYEKNAPSLDSYSVITFENYSRLIIAEVTDESGIRSVKAKLHLLTTGTVFPDTIILSLTDPDGDNNYTKQLYFFDYAEFSVDIETIDIFGNKETYLNLMTVEVGTYTISIPFSFIIISTPIIIGIIILIRKKVIK